MECIGRAPATFDEWTAIIENCAIAYGGPSWTEKATTGLICFLMIASAVLLIWVLLRFISEK